MIHHRLRGLQKGGGAPVVSDVFATSLYTGNGSTQTITNGIDLAGEGGLVWGKPRNVAYGHGLCDTLRGVQKELDSSFSNSTMEWENGAGLTAFNANGFSVGGNGVWNESTKLYVAWTFRKAPRFFDVVTYTGNGVAGREITHGLGIAPGMIIIKDTNGTANWFVSRSTQTDAILFLNTADAQLTGFADSYAATSTVFKPTYRNAVDTAYVAYLFAHDTETDGVIQCGSFTATGSTQTINIGFTPQFLIVKGADNAFPWRILDTARGIADAHLADDAVIQANSANAETLENIGKIVSNGFEITAASVLANINYNYIYLAIRAEA